MQVGPTLTIPAGQVEDAYADAGLPPRFRALVAIFAAGTFASFDSLISVPVSVSFFSFLPATERFLSWLPSMGLAR